MPNFQHCGLYFTPDHIQAAHENINREPIQAAWVFLSTQSLNDNVMNDSELILHAYRYKLSSNHDSGDQVVRALQSGYGLDIHAYTNYFDALVTGVTLAHAAELVRDHANFVSGFAAWQSDYANFVDQLQHTPESSTILDHVWLGFLNLVSGIVLDADDRFDAGCEVFRQTIAEVRPEGYLVAAVEAEGQDSINRQFFAVAALVCMAEAASHVGVDLWGYNYRGISVITAAAYITYYYYYPTQWHWGAIAEEPAKALFSDHGSFLEMVYHYTRPGDLKLLLNEQRPLFNAALGGLTTLTHAVPAKERRGLFG
ncbi:MAG: alginate lyase family protein [Chloroflexota bacterium]